MTLRVSDPFLSLKIVHCVLLFMLLFSGGLIIYSYQAYASHLVKTERSLEIAVNFLNSKINDSFTANEFILSTASMDCHSSEPTFNKVILEMPSIQTLNLIADNKVICSSLAVNVGEPVNPEEYLPVDVLVSRTIVPGKPILITKSQRGDFTVISTLHGPTLFSVIKLFNEQTYFTVDFPTSQIDVNLNVNNQKPLHDLYLQQSLVLVG